ncbi:DUF1295 domain-containing protein [Leucobacter sp. PH1c]|uniref:DUF1295 domain-containing protein n=1 Tax=Leucobacter sp. PH1c TaxID=1397278 RepID=UPI00046935FC|nr:DUF1295 domain-containing protein [Leucobacter sp. PH1c]
MQQTRGRSIALISASIVLGALLALAGSQHGATLGGFPLFALAVLAAFVVQWLAFIPAALGRTDRFFDATGSLTYIMVTATLLLLVPAAGPRGIVLGTMVIVWALRLGSFLLLRNIRSGGDDRFAEITGDPVRFLSVWSVQGLWVSLTAAAAWIAITSGSGAEADGLLWIGLGVWAVGFAIEVIADLQKSRFKQDPTNDGQFIRTGLWSVVRHPNYLGEILLWSGVLVAAAPALRGWQWVALLSPVFVVLLLTRVSGIPLLEAKAEKKWGEDPEYRAYVARTPRLIPFTRRR